MERESYLKMYEYEDCHWWFVARRLIIRNVLRHYFSEKKTRSILEIGCGSGGNLEMLSAFGKVYALEPDEEGMKRAGERKIGDVRRGSLPDEIPFAEKFDLICMFDVLEHIDDDLKTLKVVGEMLNPGGKILLTVPSYNFLWSSHDFSLNHKRRYIRKTLVDNVSKTGLSVKYSSYFNAILMPYIAVVRIFHNIIGKRGRSDDLRMPSSLVNSLLCKLFSSERFFIPGASLPFGVSVLLIAEKMKSSENKQA